MINQTFKGHLIALLTIFIWGMTFISTKILLQICHPVEILFIRFVIGFFALLIICPKPLPQSSLRQEVLFILAGFTGVCLYFLLENIALTYTQAANVSIIIATAPFFTLLLSRLFGLQESRIHISFLIGFISAILGIFLLSCSDAALQLNPLGDFLALSAAFVWAIYSVLIKKINSLGFNLIVTTRHIFLYGILFTLPVFMLIQNKVSFKQLLEPVYLFNILFLGLGASAMCFVTWSYAVKTLGAVKTSIYIYLNPVITVFGSVLILHEHLTGLMILGVLLTIFGLLISEQPNPSHVIKKKRTIS